MALAPSVARAQEPSVGLSIAEQLFVAGKSYMQDQDYDKACEKFKASHDLDRAATGTLLNLALCHELTNRPASAWAEFRQVAAESRGKREDRVRLATEKADALLPTLSTLTVAVGVEARSGGLVVELDRQPIDAAAWGTPLPVDPGTHVLAAVAPGKLSWRHEIEMGPRADHLEVAVPVLEDAPVARPVVIAPDGTVTLLTAEEVANARARRIIGFALGGAGIAALGAGIAFGVAALGKNSDARDLCPSDKCARESDVATARDGLSAAKTDASICTVAIGAGIVAIAGGIVLVLTAPGRRAEPPQKVSSVRLTPAPLARGGALILGGTW